MFIAVKVKSKEDHYFSIAVHLKVPDFKEVTKRKILSFTITAQKVTGLNPVEVTANNALNTRALFYFLRQISFVLSPKRQGKRQGKKFT